MRLTQDGTLDNSLGLVTISGQSVTDIDTQADEKILVVGLFSSVLGERNSGVVRLFNNITFGFSDYDFDGDGRADIGIFRPSNNL